MLVKLLAVFLFLLSIVSSQTEIREIEYFKWLDNDDKSKPILEICILNGTLIIPLREAPFCRPWKTHKCECYILRKTLRNESSWSVGSFVKCKEGIQGEFMNSSGYFTMEPKGEGEKMVHTMRIFKKNFTAENLTIGKWPNMKKYQRNWKNLKFLKPLSEYGELQANETAFITCLFVISNLITDTLQMPKFYEDAYLQNLVNVANQFYKELNLLIINLGWTKALSNHVSIRGANASTKFVYEEFHNYVDERNPDVVVLNAPGEGTAPFFDVQVGRKCFDSNGAFIRYDEYRGVTLLRFYLQAIGAHIGLTAIDPAECGDPPENTMWIMDKSTPLSYQRFALRWSDCTIENMKKSRKRLACFRGKVEPYMPSCGNGIVEDDEQCDCVSRSCWRCCNEACRFTYGSFCSNGPCCDLSRCDFASPETQCRASVDFCDIPELCNGTSSECPPNWVVANGYKCKGPPHAAYCFNGMCGSRQDICGWAFLKSTVAENYCYNYNLKGGSSLGGCGPTFQSRKDGISYFACKPENELCGKVYCGLKDGGLKPTFTDDSFDYFNEYAVLSPFAPNNKNCHSMNLDKYFRYLREDPTFVPNGSECGSNRMCIKQTCSPLPGNCPDNCSGVIVKNPYTGESFPAFVLPDPDRGQRLKIEPWKILPNWAIIVLLVLFLIGIIFTYKNLGRVKKVLCGSHLKSSSSEVDHSVETSQKTDTTSKLPRSTSSAKSL